MKPFCVLTKTAQNVILDVLGQEVFDVEDNLKESGRLKVFNIQSGFYQNQFQPGLIIHVFQTWHRAEPGTGQRRAPYSS